MESCASRLLFSIPIWLICSRSHAFLCSYIDIIILSFRVIASITAITFLKDQYSCTSFRTFTFIAGQQWNTHFDNMPMCSSSIIASHISFAIMHSGMFVLTSIPAICLSFPILLLCLDSQSAMNSNGPGLYRIPMLYQWMCNVILCSLCDRFTKSF